MKKYICEMCGKKVSLVHDHHVIPWWFLQDDSDSNIMRVCPTCHGKADAGFINFIVRGTVTSARTEMHKRTAARYTKNYRRTKVLFYIKLLKRTFYQDMVRYNVKTGNVFIFTRWSYQPYKYQDTTIKSRAQLDKAALSKGQVTLGV